jgi:HPt (histidine-containing phosphotransfer) domain-containing protein
MDELRESFSDRLAERVREIEAAWEAALAAAPAGAGREPLRQLHRLAHSLHGTAGTFGHPTAGDAAQDLERGAKALLDGVGVPDLAALAPLLAALRGTLGRP